MEIRVAAEQETARAERMIARISARQEKGAMAAGQATPPPKRPRSPSQAAGAVTTTSAAKEAMQAEIASLSVSARPETLEDQGAQGRGVSGTDPRPIESTVFRHHYRSGIKRWQILFSRSLRSTEETSPCREQHYGALRGELLGFLVGQVTGDTGSGAIPGHHGRFHKVHKPDADDAGGDGRCSRREK